MVRVIEASDQDQSDPRRGRARAGQGTSKADLLCPGKEWPKQGQKNRQIKAREEHGLIRTVMSRTVIKVAAGLGQTKCRKMHSSASKARIEKNRIREGHAG